MNRRLRQSTNISKQYSAKKNSPNELEDYGKVWLILTVFEYGKVMKGTVLNSLQITPQKPLPTKPQTVPFDGVLSDCGREGEPRVAMNSNTIFNLLRKNGRLGFDNEPSEEECRQLQSEINQWVEAQQNQHQNQNNSFTVEGDIMKSLANFLQDLPPFEYCSKSDSKMEM